VKSQIFLSNGIYFDNMGKRGRLFGRAIIKMENLGTRGTLRASNSAQVIGLLFWADF
jgi:hypothetical protein